ncbi:verrucotoxin subunit beta-like isoform X2 [Pygocentrus nattereri]|uniref:Fibronectin type-III domain-containing protein n=1 Tax=Pygocentrus nattereri TaxID=42514 RepID=A0AAR2LTV0_PYGNA|nr:verrucotoxin subunit beta-like isoform X2 [Pygocentrus nattereri]
MDHQSLFRIFESTLPLHTETMRIHVRLRDEEDEEDEECKGSAAMDSEDFDIVEVAGLGRPFQLGMAYDYRKHKLLPGLTLWDYEGLQAKICVSDQYDTKFDLLSSDSSDDKTSTTKISAYLKIAALCRIVDVSGSCTYFTDEKKSEKKAKLTLSYHATTKFKQLSMDHLTQISYLSELKGTGATHIVVAILYGADAYFVFERELDSHKNKWELEGELKLTIQKLSFLATGELGGSGERKDSEKHEFEKTSCTFHGDFKLESNPCTLQDALQVYTKLPYMLGEKGEHAVPLQVWLYPLSKLPKSRLEESDCIVREISDTLNTRMSHAIDRLNMIEGKVNDLMNNEVAKSLALFHSKLQDLKQKFSQHKADFMTNLAHLLPLIRGYDKEESDLVDLLQTYEDSLFNSPAMDRWLEYRKMESDVLGSFLKQLRETGVNLDEDLHILLSDAEIENVVSFTFTSLDLPDEFLSDLAKPDEAEKKTPDEIPTWLTRGIIKTMRKNLSLFKDLKRSNNDRHTTFNVSSQNNLVISDRSARSSHHEIHPGACIMLYEGGSDEPICFTPPTKPVFSATIDVCSRSIIVKLNPKCRATVKRTLEYKPRTKEGWKTLAVQRDEEKLTNLESGSEYEIRCTAVGKLEELPVTSDIISVRPSDTLEGTE